jgi:hypothetical protein
MWARPGVAISLEQVKNLYEQFKCATRQRMISEMLKSPQKRNQVMQARKP